MKDPKELLAEIDAEAQEKLEAKAKRALARARDKKERAVKSVEYAKDVLKAKRKKLNEAAKEEKELLKLSTKDLAAKEVSSWSSATVTFSFGETGGSRTASVPPYVYYSDNTAITTIT